MPRRFLGQVSRIEEPVMVVGLVKELEYKAGALLPHVRRVIEMPRAVNDLPRTRRPARDLALLSRRMPTTSAGRLVRGAIAEGLYRKKIPVPANLAVTSIPSREQVTNFGEAAICYVARHRDAAQSLVDGTHPGSKKEADAVMAMSDGISECIPPNAKKTLALDTTPLRFRLAEALRRLGIVPGGGHA